MFDQQARAIAVGAQPEREVDARIAKGMKAQARLETAQCPFNGGHYVARNFKCNPLDFRQVAVVMDAYIHRHAQLFFGQAEVDDDARRQFGIRYHHFRVAEHANMRAAPSDSADVALLAALKLDEIARRDRLFGNHENAGEKVGEGILQRQRHGERSNTEGSQDWRNRDADGAKENQHAEGNQEATYTALQKALSARPKLANRRPHATAAAANCDRRKETGPE